VAKAKGEANKPAGARARPRKAKAAAEAAVAAAIATAHDQAPEAPPAPPEALQAAPRTRGGQDTYTEAIAEEICDRLANGEFLRVICRDDHMPAWRTVYAWIEARPDFDARIARARAVGFDAIAEDSIVMLDEKPGMVGTMFGDKVDSGHVAWQKNRADQRLKMLAKWSPTKFGDAVNVKHSGAVGVAQVEMEADQAVRVAQAILDGMKG
jgi:hypothetical protein